MIAKAFIFEFSPTASISFRTLAVVEKNSLPLQLTGRDFSPLPQAKDHLTNYDITNSFVVYGLWSARRATSEFVLNLLHGR